jgi:hypothetical protein
MTDAAEHFDWNPRGADADNIVVRAQPAVAVYLNPHGEVVVRQVGHYGPDEDQFVFVAPENVLRVTKRMLAVAGIDRSNAEPPTEQLLLPAPKDTTAAEADAPLP